MAAFKNYLSLVKFSHTIFAMPFALIGFFLGIFKPVASFQWGGTTARLPRYSDSYPSHPFEGILGRFTLVILCMVTARSAAMAFNRYLDANFDAKNPRTAIREIPAGIISANHALLFVILNCIAFVFCTWFINKTCFFLSPVALFVILFYSYTKRFTILCHLVLGLGLSLAPIGAYVAVTSRFDVLPVLFSFAVLFWVSGFDIIYALQDVEFDVSQNLYSLPAALGKSNALKVSEMLHFLSAGLVIAAGFAGAFGLMYWTGVVVFTGMLIYQHTIVKPNDLRRVNLAFMTANGIASVVFACFVLADIILKKHGLL
jgi:4-hydroxybenzoate polyprenyltransferase